MAPEADTPCHTAMSPAVYRLGTPASEMDVPLTAVPTGPVARDASQSVPPNMQYRQQNRLSRTSSRMGAGDWRRPSMQLPALHEGLVLANPERRPRLTKTDSSNTVSSKASSESTATANSQPTSVPDPAKHAPTTRYFTYGEDCSHAGWMRKRKTKLLRHEWQDAHFRLKGTQLAMHANARLSSAAMDTIDVDHYAVSCSSAASGSKLSAAMKAFSLKNGSEASKADATAFAFQLVPTRDGGAAGGASGAETGPKKLEKINGKTHHFAVKTKDERIDWMRELMLAKALQQKGKGYEVEVNGVPMA